MGILGGFPTLGGEAATLEAGVVQAVGSTIEAAEEVGEKFLTGYTSIIDGMMMHLENPDFEMAEEQREAITAYAEALQPQFQEFSEELQERLDDITP